MEEEKLRRKEKADFFSKFWEEAEEETGGYVKKTMICNFENGRKRDEILYSSQVYMCSFNFSNWNKVWKDELDDEGNVIGGSEEFETDYMGYPYDLIGAIGLSGEPTRETVNWIIPHGKGVNNLHDFAILSLSWIEMWRKKVKKDYNRWERNNKHKIQKSLENRRKILEED